MAHVWFTWVATVRSSRSLALTRRLGTLFRICRPISEMMSPEYRVTLSIGGATAEAAHSSFADLYRHADRNLYQVKQQGRDQTVTT